MIMRPPIGHMVSKKLSIKFPIKAAHLPNMFLVRDPKNKRIGGNGIFGDFKGAATAYLPGY